VGTYERHRDGILAYFAERQTSGQVEGLNNKARVILKRAYGLKSTDSLWTRLILEVNRADEKISRTINEMHQLANRIFIGVTQLVFRRSAANGRAAGYPERMTAPRCTPTDYIDFLLATPKVVSATEAARAQPERPRRPAHDAFTRLLHRLEPDPATLWAEVAPLLRRGDGCWCSMTPPWISPTRSGSTRSRSTGPASIARSSGAST
jgi:hypothetical protein